MNPDCYILGSVANNQSAPSDAKAAADRRREARKLSESISNPVPTTREQRIAEARAIAATARRAVIQS